MSAFASTAFSQSAYSVAAFDFGTAPIVTTTLVPPEGPGQRFSYWTPVKARDWKERQRKPDTNQEHPHFPTPAVKAEPPSPETLALLFAAFHAVDD